MAHRHKVHKAKGGRTVYSGKGSHVEHEAEERKHGGRAAHMDGKKGKHRFDRRARGGGVGADKSPFSSAATGKNDRGRTSHTVPHAFPK